jgi:N-methylhydantoinase A/oxoprolinase/acetone carboxylase beta subunit
VKLRRIGIDVGGTNTDAVVLEDGRVVHAVTTPLEGGHDYDGRPIVPFDATGTRQVARQIREDGIRALAIAAIASPLHPGCEQRARAIPSDECPDVAVTVSHDLGRIGLLGTRERREEAIAAAEAQARKRADAAGADRASLQTVDVEDLPLAYLPGNALRVRVRVAGEVASSPDQNGSSSVSQ